MNRFSWRVHRSDLSTAFAFISLFLFGQYPVLVSWLFLLAIISFSAFLPLNGAFSILPPLGILWVFCPYCSLFSGAAFSCSFSPSCPAEHRPERQRTATNGTATNGLSFFTSRIDCKISITGRVVAYVICNLIHTHNVYSHMVTIYHNTGERDDIILCQRKRGGMERETRSYL